MKDFYRVGFVKYYFDRTATNRLRKEIMNVRI